MKNDLHTCLNAALHQVDWHGEARVLEIIHHQRTKHVHPGRMVALAVLLVALVATALALGLGFSARFNAQQQARCAVMERYGLTDEMMDLFTYEAQQDGTARFTMQLINADRLGEYTAAFADGAWTATWSHDDADDALLQSGDLSSPAWGAKQLERLLPMYRQREENWSQVLDIGQLTLEERAALDAPMLTAQGITSMINIAPSEGDILPDEAERLARGAVENQYGVRPEGPATVHFFLYGDTQRREYRVDLDGYVVYVASPSGEITYCRWFASAAQRSLPTGDLAHYPQAAEEYVASGAFDLLSPAEKAAIAQRYAEAGLAELLRWETFVSPEPEDVPEAAAQQKAEEALAAAYGLPEGWQALFLCRTSLVMDNHQRCWVVEFLPRELTNWRFRDCEKLGTYTAMVEGTTGQVTSCSWSMSGMDLTAYTEQSLGAAPAFDGRMLPWVQALLEDLQAILDQYPASINLDEMSLMDRGAYALRMRQAGYSAKEYPDLIPETTDIPRQQAADLAWEALNATYDLTGRSLSRGTEDQEALCLAQLTDGSWARVWSIVYTDNVDVFTIHVHAETGEIENIWHDSPAFSNG